MLSLGELMDEAGNNLVELEWSEFEVGDDDNTVTSAVDDDEDCVMSQIFFCPSLLGLWSGLDS